MPPDAWAATRGSDEPYLLINPVSAWKRKSYDASKWAILLAHARDLGMTRVVMTGGTEEWQRTHCTEIATQAATVGVTLEDLSGRTNLREFLHLVSRASMILCVDGAAAHLARSFGVPCITIFGPSYRWMWHLEDPLNIALEAAQFSEETRPSASMIPVEVIQAAFTQLAGFLRKPGVLGCCA
jgi:ADP-heptose:LPS heptosyltransferase